MNPRLSFDQPVPQGGRIHAYSAAAHVGVIYPLSDGRATWWLFINGDRGEAKSIEAAKDSLSEKMGSWMDEAGLQQIAGDTTNQEAIF